MILGNWPKPSAKMLAKRARGRRCSGWRKRCPEILPPRSLHSDTYCPDCRRAYNQDYKAKHRAERALKPARRGATAGLATVSKPPESLRTRVLELAVLNDHVTIKQAVNLLETTVVMAAIALVDLAAGGYLVAAVGAVPNKAFARCRYYPTLKGRAWLLQRRGLSTQPKEQADGCDADQRTDDRRHKAHAEADQGQRATARKGQGFPA